MIVKGRRRVRARRKRGGFARLVFATAILLFSAAKITNDAAHRGAADTAAASTSAIEPAVKKVALKKNRPVVVASLDPIVTRSARLALDDPPDGVNRNAKGDMVVIRKIPRVASGTSSVNAGLIQTVALYAPADSSDKGVYGTFLLPPPKQGIVATKAPIQAAAPVKTATKTERDRSSGASVALAYAAEPPKDKPKAAAAIDSVMSTKIPPGGLLVPNVDLAHAWVNSPLPSSARSKGEMKCLATAIYFEARGEPERGQLAVAQVVINRLKNPAYPKTICGVVYQNKNMRNRCQFSFACDGIKDRITDAGSWNEAQALAKKVVFDDRTMFQADVGTSTHYHANYVRPRWARHMKKMQKIGRHIFYKTYGGGWS